MTLTDIQTRKKVAGLAAYGLADKTIADSLFLSEAQMEEVKASEEYKLAYSEKLMERAETAIVLEEGWDGVETAAVAKVLQGLQYSSDPRFALQAAAIANRAVRRTPKAHQTIDASKAGGMIILSMNKRMIDGNKVSEQSATLVIEQNGNNVSQLAKKRTDIPSPKRVAEILGIAQNRGPEKVLDELEQIAEAHGIDRALFED